MKNFVQNVKINNTTQILNCILQHEKISRIEISEVSGLAPSTVGQVISTLLESGVVRESCEGKSTGGRKPIMIEITPDFGCVVIFEIKRSGLDAKIFNMCSQLIGNESISSKMIVGNALLYSISNYVDNIKNGKTIYPTCIAGIGLLCQDDIPDYELNTEFSTSISTDIIRLEVAVAAKCAIPVQKELINRYTLDYYLKQADYHCVNYAYINIGERITASFVLENCLVRKNNDSIFDLSSAVLNQSLTFPTSQPAKTVAYAQELALKRLSPETLAEKLAQILSSALSFFPVDQIFIGGQIENLDKIVEIVSSKKQLYAKTHKAKLKNECGDESFARSILTENCMSLIRGSCEACSL